MRGHWTVLFLIACGTSPSPQPDASEGPFEERHREPHSLPSHVPVPFQENDGQWDERVVFKVDVHAGTVWVTREGQLVYSLVSHSQPTSAVDVATASNDPSSSSSTSAGTIEPPDTITNLAWTLVESFVNGHANEPRGEDRAETNVSYFIGNDSSRWATNVSTFGSVTLGYVWPGVEVRLVARAENVEKFFHVAPGADATAIEIRLEGASNLRLSGEGALVASTRLGAVELSRPVAYQDIDGVRHEVQAEYDLVGDDSYRFAIGNYDTNHELVIDPILQSTFVGGGADDTLGTMLVTPGELIVGGTTSGTSFPGTTGGFQANFGGGSFDIVLERLSLDLGTIRQVTYLGGNGSEGVSRLALDAGGNIVGLGGTNSPNFPTTLGSVQRTWADNNSWSDLVVFRFNSSLQMLLHSTYLGGYGSQSGSDFAIAADGDIVVLGGSYTIPSFFPQTGGAEISGGYDMILSRLSPNLDLIRQSRYLTFSSQNDYPASVLIGPTGTIFVAGTSFGNGGDRFVVVELSSDLTNVVAGPLFGPDGSSITQAIWNAGEIVATGSVGGGLPASSSGAQPDAGGGGDAFLVRIDPTLAAVNISTYFGGPGGESATALIEDSTGAITLIASASNQRLSSVATLQPRPFQSDDGGLVLARFSSDLFMLLGASYFGRDNDIVGQFSVLGRSGSSLYVATTTAYSAFWPPFPGTNGGAQELHGGSGDFVVSRVTEDLAGCQTAMDCRTELSQEPTFEDTRRSRERTTCDVSTGQCVECITAADCDDGIDCTTDICTFFGECQNSSPTPPGFRCVTGFCNGAGMCVECAANDNCTTSNPCQTGMCSSERCTFINVADGLRCANGGTCVSGQCLGATCDGDSDCSAPTPFCETSVGRCVGCTDPRRTCDVGQVCDAQSGRCVASTTLDPNGDEDQDGIRNGIECAALTNCPDTDQNGTPDYLDPDDDGDTKPTLTECPAPAGCVDSDNDGTPNYLDRDDDGDGIRSADEVTDGTNFNRADADLDGLTNCLDLDSDGDGSTDRVEGRNAAPSSIPFYLDANYLGGGGLAGGASQCSLRTANHGATPPSTLLVLLLVGILGRRLTRASDPRLV